MWNINSYNFHQNSQLFFNNYREKILSLERRGVILKEIELNDLTIIYLQENISNETFNLYIVAKDHIKNKFYFRKCIQAILGERIEYFFEDEYFACVKSIQIMNKDKYSYNKSYIIDKCIYLSKYWFFLNFRDENFIFTNRGLIFTGIDYLLLKDVLCNFNIMSPLGNNIIQDFSNIFFSKENLFIDNITYQPVALDKIQYSIDFLKKQEERVKCMQT